MRSQHKASVNGAGGPDNLDCQAAGTQRSAFLTGWPGGSGTVSRYVGVNGRSRCAAVLRRTGSCRRVNHRGAGLTSLGRRSCKLISPWHLVLAPPRRRLGSFEMAARLEVSTFPEPHARRRMPGRPRLVRGRGFWR
ncbi:hypothetical protein VTK26DRAFT_8519 [Humicola hyalothermophila]